MSNRIQIDDSNPASLTEEPSVITENKFNANVDETVLVVDLDGTLIRTDLLHEAFFHGIVRSPVRTAQRCSRLSEGIAPFKHALAQDYTPDVATLPFRQDILDFIKEERSRGRTIVLATASCRAWAEKVAEHLEIFDHVLASDSHTNLKGTVKLDAIREFCAEHGFDDFAYIGDSHADIPIWEHASEIIVAEHDSSLLRKLKQYETSIRVFGGTTSKASAVMSVLRPHQWAKNTLLFVPLITSLQISNIQMVFQALIAFFSISMVASGVYVLNDFLDVEFDRRHHRKKKRPFASGQLPLMSAIPLAGAVLLLGAVSTWAFLPIGFVAVLSVYFVLTSAYSLFIKRVMIGDVMVLAGLYALRVFAGGVACSIPISDWLLAFSLFIFVSLGFLKRYVELTHMNDSGVSVTPGRGYEVGDLSLIESMGIASGMMSVVVLALYIQSDQVRNLYRSTTLLWILCPFLMYWLCRVWILARRRQMHDDPIAFALTDKVSLFVVSMAFVVLMLAAYVP